MDTESCSSGCTKLTTYVPEGVACQTYSIYQRCKSAYCTSTTTYSVTPASLLLPSPFPTPSPSDFTNASISAKPTPQPSPTPTATDKTTEAKPTTKEMREP